MQITLKDNTVQLSGCTLHAFEAICAAANVWSRQGLDALVITSARDGDHRPGSMHYQGDAIDLRSRNLPDAFSARDRLQTLLGDEYDVVLEADHIHVEYDPRT